MKTSIENRKTNRKANVKDYFQRLMMLIAILVVSTALVGCDILTDDDDDPGTTPTGKIDAKLLGKWGFMTNYYYFLKDGSFTYVTAPSPWVSVHNGKFTTSNSRVYLTNIVNVNFENTKYKDQNLGYSFGTDGEGEYLLIPQYEPLSDSYGGDVSTWEPKKWRKDKTYVP
jgi:hypothetical protein